MLEIELISFVILSTLLIAIALIKVRNIVIALILNTTFSLFTILLYLILDAPDVAMTEASVSVIIFIIAVFTIRSNYKISHIFEDSFKPFIFLGCSALAATLIYASADLPEFGFPKFNNYYLHNSGNEIGIKSVVASILASYRGYDTMLETLVILIGGIGVLLISGASIKIEQNSDILITLMTRIMLPIILLFSLYIQANGENSPGGGFQAGAIMATIFITYALANGKLSLLNLISLSKLKIIAN
jgi:multicomponent Na+:H+ antiporter subunit B